MVSLHHQLLGSLQLLCLWISIFGLMEVRAQQFPDSPLPFNYPGMTSDCVKALNTAVTCSPLLVKVAER